MDDSYAGEDQSRFLKEIADFQYHGKSQLDILDLPQTLSEYKFIPPYTSPLEESIHQQDENYHFNFPGISVQPSKSIAQDTNENRISSKNSVERSYKNLHKSYTSFNHYCMCDLSMAHLPLIQDSFQSLGRFRIPPLKAGKRWGLQEDKILF